MIRFFDITFSLFGIVIGFPLFILSWMLSFWDTGKPIFTQTRLGKNAQPFTLIKFRTMNQEQTDLATHLVSKHAVSSIGHFLRKNKLDELPQLWNVLKGDMSIVGPRPNLLNQNELITQRTFRGVYKVLPGITGLSQVCQIDMSKPELLAKTDARMIAEMSILTYFRYIFITLFGAGRGDKLVKD